MTYQYGKLDSAKHIRLLSFPSPNLTESADEQINIQLRQYAINELPRYQALSYCWGGTERPLRVNVESDGHIDVTESLHAALTLLRAKAKNEIFLWIDAICINQEDLAERSSQVALMSQIYQNAREVVIWLHPAQAPALERNEAHSVVQKPGVEDYYKDDEGRWARRPRAKEDYQVVEIPGDIMQVFRHPWFTRIWILQEVAYARNIVVRYGRKMLLWDEILDWVGKNFNRATDPRNSPCDDLVEVHMAMVQLMDRWRTDLSTSSYDMTFSEVFEHAIYCEATERKDRVFALLSLAMDIGLYFKPQYEWTEAEIAYQIAKESIEMTNTLDVLRCIGSRDNDDVSGPSWIPDLLDKIECRALRTYSRPFVEHGNDQANKRPVIKGMDASAVEVRALRVLEIEQVLPSGRRWTDENRNYSLFDTLFDWYYSVQCHDLYENKSARDRLNTFWGTMRMTLGSEAIAKHIHDVYERGEGWHWHFRKIFEDDFGDVGDSQPEDPYDPETEIDDSNIFDAESPELYTPWAKDVLFPLPTLRHIDGRAFGFTNKGQMALLPRNARKGDEIVLLYGIRLPFVLRWREKVGYQVVGPCYIHQRFSWEMLERTESWEQMQWIRLV